MVPCRAVSSLAELFWRDSVRLLRPFSSAGAAGADVTAAEAHQEANRSAGCVHPPSPPSLPHTIRRAESVLYVYRCAAEEEEGEDERMRG